ncbi:MAG: hypothetical protein Q9183_004012 [Haloplaca sp. 2 TL-2023]
MKLVDVYPAVCRIAKLLGIDFSFLKPKSRHKVSSTPEIALVSLLIISVKLHYPFDTMDIHPHSLSDAATLKVNWDCWCEVQKKHDAIETANGKLGRGNEIKVTEEDVSNLSGEQMDEYLDWFEKTWVNEERARKHPRGHAEQLLDMFPTGRPTAAQPAPSNPAQGVQDEEAALEAKLEMAQGSLRPRNIIADGESGDEQGPVNRVGSYYKRYRRMEDLEPTGRAFHEAAAKLIAVKPHTLLVAVGQIESKLLKWRRQKADQASTSETKGDTDKQGSDRRNRYGQISVSSSTAMNVAGPPRPNRRRRTSTSKARQSGIDSDSQYTRDDSS